MDPKATAEMNKAIELFNTKPRQGIQQLISAHLIENDPYPIAKFLFSCPGLNKRKVGDYLGEPDETSQEVLEHYVSLFDFTCLDLDIALRRLLAKFHLPGEAQKIDRIMQKFAKQYFADNTDNGIFAGTIQYREREREKEAHRKKKKTWSVSYSGFFLFVFRF